jgi:iron complex outermembrane receptor protein
MKIIKVLSLICFLTIGIFAQNTARIEGKLIQHSDAVFKPAKKSIQNITVSLLSKPKNDEVAETKTDDEGNFVFENVASGDYLIIVECDYCMRGQIIEEITIVAGQNVQLKVELPKVTVRETVTISADTRQSVDEVSKTVNVINNQEIKDRNEFSLTDSLRTIPGFRVQQLGGFGKFASIKTRGLRNQDTAVLLDGIRFRDASAITGDASSFLSDFTLTSVDRIEILRGSGSSLYGTNAIGGTIDFLTPKPTNGFHGGLFGELGGLGLERFRGNLSGGNDLIGFNFGLSRTVFSEGIDKEDDARNTNFQSRIEYNPFSKTNISARFFFSDAFVRLNSNPDTLGTLPPTNATIVNANPGVNFIFDENDPDNLQRSKFFNGQIVLTQIINKDLVFQGVYSGLKTSRKNENNTLGVGFQSASTSLFDGTIQTASGLLNWTPVENNNVKIGYEYEWEKFGNEGFSPNPTDAFTTSAKQTGSAFYVQDLLSFFDNKLQLAGAFRAQIFSLKSPGFSATNPPYSNLNLESPPTAYTFDGAGSYFFEKSGTKIRAHIGNGYRVPSLYERFGTFFSSFFGGFVALGDPNLKPEKTIAFDFGVEQNLSNNRVRLTATYFYTKLIDTIGFGNVVPDIGTTTRPFGGYLNTKGGIARGGEFSGQFSPTATTKIFASYTFTNSDQRMPQVSGNSNIKTLGIPDHQFTFVFSQSIKRLTLNLDFLATSSYLAPIFSNTTFSTYTYRFKGARKADLTAGYEIPTGKDKLRFRLFGTIENLFGYDYYENGFRTAGRTARGGLGVSF